MDQLPKGLISYFVSFIKSHSTDETEANKLVRKMLSMKSVQTIIFKAMYKLEPIISDELNYIRNPTSTRSLSNPVRKTRLLVLSNLIKNQLENFLNIQDKIANVLNLVDNIDFTVEPITETEVKTKEAPNELVNFLSALSAKTQISNYEIEEISDDTWNKHMEVEKMLKMEMQKYYMHLDGLENKYFERNLAVKFKTAKKIERLEEELKATWEHFRLMVDQTSMMYEDQLSKETEILIGEQKLLDENNSPELQVRDYSSAVAKIKSLFTVRKILEKRKEQNERLVSGLNSKISILNQKISMLTKGNLELIDNCSSLSWCLEFIFSHSEMPEAVKAKALRLLEKQKCQKLEALFKVDDILEKYSVETVSRKFEELKEGIATVTSSLKDENAKIKLSRLINESRLDEVDRRESMKKLKVPSPTPVSAIKPRGKGKKDLMPIKEVPKKESLLEKMRKEMMSIDEEMHEAEKHIEEVIIESQKVYSPSISEIIPKPKSRGQVVKNVNKSSLSPKSQKSCIKTEGSSYMYEEVIKENKSTQVENRGKEVGTQMEFLFFEKILELVNGFRAKVKNSEKMRKREVEDFIFEACKEKLKERVERFVQTEKESSLFEFSTPSNSLIRGIMSKIKTKKKEKKVIQKELVDSSVSESLIITKLIKKEENLFKTQVEEVDENLGENFEEISLPKPRHVQSIVLKPSTSTVPNSSLSSFLKNFTALTSSKLSELSKTIIQKPSGLESASDQYKKEFVLQAQLKGIKKMSFEDIQQIWEEVINRRIIEGEKDKISVYLRGYLGTDRYDQEKSKIISLMLNESSNKKANFAKNLIKSTLIKKWRRFMIKLFEKKSFNFKSIITEKDSPREILFKAAKNLKFVKHRLKGRGVSEESVKKKPEPLINYSADKWSLNSTSVSPFESMKKSSRMILNKKKHYPRLMAKTPVREKLLNSEGAKLPFI